MLEGNEGMEQDVGTQESSPSETSTPESVTEVSAAESTGTQKQSAESSQPFHEHPRFKELIEERNTFKSEIENMRRQMEELRKPPKENKEHPFVSRLKEIDPQYGEWASNQEKLAEKLSQFEQWQQEQTRTAIVQQYETGISKLHDQYKVPSELQEIYKEALDAAAIKNPKLGLKDLPNVYKQVHDKFSKLLESTKRAERASYVVDKSKDAKAPATQPKGAPATGTKKPAHTDREAMLGSIVQRALKNSKAEGEI
jgi:hypothetical protein